MSRHPLYPRPAGPVRHQAGAGRPAAGHQHRQPQDLHHRLRRRLQPCAVSGKVCLIQRGTVDFATKVTNCQNSGGVGAVVYNNVAGPVAGTLGTTVTTIPSVGASDTEGAAMKGQLGQSATVGCGK
ncbi:MAG: PA domain-containing protein [Telluria sp.]